MTSEKKFYAPKPTESEKVVREILKANNLKVTTGKVIWYTESDMYTPDIIIGRKGKELIVEVDGKIHKNNHQKNKDRIRQRALESMGYKVFRVKNEEVQRRPADVAANIIGEYSELIASDNKKEIKITELETPANYEPIPKELDEKLDNWIRSFNNDLNDERWKVDFFRESLSRFDPSIIKSKSIMEKVILLLHGLNLHKNDDGNLDFKYSLSFFKKSINLLNEMFGNDDMIGLHLKNRFNTSTANFFKNLIFQGGPNIKKGLIKIKDKDTLDYHIVNFNENLSELGITVDRLDIKHECKAKLKNINQKEKIKYDWLIEWMNNSS